MMFDLEIDIEDNDEEFWGIIDKNCAELEQKEVAVGFWGDEKEQRTGYEIWKVAAVMNFGSISKNIPARNFMNLGAAHFEFTEGNYVSRMITSAVTGNLNVDICLKRIGFRIKRHLRQAILDQNFTPISERWKKDKISRGKDSRILIESSKLLNSVKVKVGSITYDEAANDEAI